VDLFASLDTHTVSERGLSTLRIGPRGWRNDMKPKVSIVRHHAHRPHMSGDAISITRWSQEA